MAEKNRVEVNINGTSYTLLCEENKEYVQNVALGVNNKITDLHKKFPILNANMLSVLAALDYADNLAKTVKMLQNTQESKNALEAEYNKLKNDFIMLNSKYNELSHENQQLKIDKVRFEERSKKL